MSRASKRLINLTKVTQQIGGKSNTDFRLPGFNSKELTTHSEECTFLFFFKMDTLAFYSP